MRKLSKKEVAAWKALYAPGDHLELGVEDWKVLAEEAEREYQVRQLELLLERVPFPEEKVA